MNGWRNWSWSGTQNFSNASPVFSGGYSISFVVTAGWGGLYLHNDMAIDISAYTMLHFAVQATRIGQKYGVALYDGNNVETKTVLLSNYGGDPPVGTFKVYDIALADLIGTGKLITGVQIQDQSGASQPAVYIDEIEFRSSGAQVIIAAPSNLTATAPSANTVNLTWTDNSTNENNFVIERSPNGSTSWTILSSTLPPNALSYSDTNVNSLATYYYRVKATNGANSSGYSNIVSVTLGSAAPLAPPSSLPIYTDAVMNGWRNWSWSSTQNFSN